MSRWKKQLLGALVNQGEDKVLVKSDGKKDSPVKIQIVFLSNAPSFTKYSGRKGWAVEASAGQMVTVDLDPLPTETEPHRISALRSECFAPNGYDKADLTGLPEYAGYSSSSYKPSPPCHEAPALVATLPSGIGLYAGGNKDAGALLQHPWALIIDLASHFVPLFNPLNDKARSLFPTLDNGPAILRVYWSDGSAPGIGLDGWKAIVKGIREADGDVLVACVGGHGRTGTAMSILLHLLEVPTEGKHPVLWLREHYCKKVVESRAQVNYIGKITGLSMKGVKERPMSSVTQVWPSDGVTQGYADDDIDAATEAWLKSKGYDSDLIGM